jgi:hypothetical protein
MLDDRKQTDTLENIGEANTGQIAEIVEAAVIALGRYGREPTEILLARVKDGPRDPYFEEGLAQLESLGGVLDGRTDEL